MLSVLSVSAATLREVVEVGVSVELYAYCRLEVVVDGMTLVVLSRR